MTLQQGLDFGASACVYGIELSHHPSPTHDREVLAPMLYCVEDVGEVPGSLSSAHLWHRIRLSDFGPITPRVTAALSAGRTPRQMPKRQYVLSTLLMIIHGVQYRVSGGPPATGQECCVRTSVLLMETR